ncbi:MAG: hypothetical protein OXH57_03110 [Ekhidna sp.]|nr:hypothetical protein [Ekhidna sp.]
MKTFFCRHSSELDIDKETHNHLWENDFIAVHYPKSKNGNEESDCDSIDPNDYAGPAKKAMNALHKISKDGGYVFSVYENQDNYKIGFVEPNTEIEIVKGKWGYKNDVQGRTALLKAIKFKKSIELNPLDALPLTCAQPRQGTICVWHKAGKKVQNLMDGINKPKKLSDLTPDLQEVLCSEFLRTGLDSSLPKLSSLLTPVGRTMKDVDIIGLAENGKRVIVQVTYSFEPQEKISRLKKYTNENKTDLIIFCKTDNPRENEGVMIYSLDEVFKRFSESETGRNWVDNIK